MGVKRIPIEWVYFWDSVEFRHRGLGVFRRNVRIALARGEEVMA